MTSPAHPVEPEPRCECRHDGGPIYTLDCPLHRNDPPPQVAQAVEPGERLEVALGRIQGVADADGGRFLGEYGFRTIKDALYEAREALRLQREREAEVERDLRREWWLHHGHDFAALYGDDGEMQCSACAHFDYKRAPLDMLREQVRAARIERAAALSDSGPSKESE